MPSPHVTQSAAAPATARLAIDGSPGPNDARALRDAALAAIKKGGDVTVDCKTAAHLHGAVIQVLLALARDLEKEGRRVRLTNVSPAVQRFLDVAGAGKSLRGEASQ